MRSNRRTRLMDSSSVTTTLHTAGCKSVKNFAVPGRRISSRSYSQQYQASVEGCYVNDRLIRGVSFGYRSARITGHHSPRSVTDRNQNCRFEPDHDVYLRYPSNFGSTGVVGFEPDRDSLRSSRRARISGPLGSSRPFVAQAGVAGFRSAAERTVLSGVRRSNSDA